MSESSEDKLDRIANRVRQATLPLFKPDGRRRPELVGCSVGIRRGDEFFLLTARHVVVDLKMADFQIWTPGRWIAGDGQIARTDPDRRGCDPLDAAVIRLNTKTANDHLRTHALTIDDLDLPVPTADNACVMQLVGYPGGEVLQAGHKTLSPTYFQWVGVSAEPAAYTKRARDIKLHSLFDFDRAQAIHNERGRHPGPDMHGASGAGIWRVLPVNEGLSRRRLALLSAIFTEYEGRMIVGTRVLAHVALINKYFPLQPT